MIDNKTANLALPLPHEDNLLQEDVGRLIDALTLIDAAISGGQILNVSELPTDLQPGKIYSIRTDSEAPIAADTGTEGLKITSLKISDDPDAAASLHDGEAVITPAKNLFTAPE